MTLYLVAADGQQRKRFAKAERAGMRFRQEGPQRLVEPGRLPGGASGRPVTGMGGERVKDFMTALILRALVHGAAAGAGRVDKRQPQSVIIRFVAAELGNR